jgi:hypothetical protein
MKAFEAMNRNLTSLERSALNAALSGSAPWLAQLREQVPRLSVVSRKYTGFGFFTDVACDTCDSATELPPAGSSARVPVAWAAHPDVDDGGEGVISFHVFLVDGVIACLEGASTSSWPETEELITFSG